MANKKTGTIAAWLTVARWTEADARAALLALQESGDTVARFAARHGVAAHRLYVWRRRLSLAMSEGVAGFVEVSRGEIASSRTEAVLEVVLTTGDVVRVPPVFDDGALRRVVAALRGGRSC